MKLSPFVLAACVLAAGAASAATIEKAEPNADTGAPIVVQFGSYASGIDGETYGNVAAFAAGSDAIERAVEAPWGREGERDLGLFPKPGRADEVRAALKKLIPDVSEKGWIKLLAGKSQKPAL